MTLDVSATIEIEASAREVLEFVLDLESYRQADTKITKVSSVTGPDDAGHGSARVRGRLPGLPAAPDRQDFSLERWHRLTLVGAPRQPGRLLFDFTGTFDCVETDRGITEVTHRYVFTFRRPFRWLERRMTDQMAHEINDEMHRLRALLTPPR